MNATIEILPFEHGDFGMLRVISQEGEPWFMAKDVCDALGIDTSHVRRGLDDDEVATLPNWQGKGAAPLIISEAGLYALALKCRKPEAKAFKRWVTHEVLPVIRKHGGYLTPEKVEEALLNPDTIIRLATDLKEERAKRQQLESENAAMAPKALFADAVAASETSILVGDLAKLIRQNGIDIGQNRLFAWLRENGWLMKSGSSHNMPTQKGMDMGLFEVKERTFQNPDGSVRVTKTTKVTGKGQQYFVNAFLSEKAVA